MENDIVRVKLGQIEQTIIEKSKNPKHVPGSKEMRKLVQEYLSLVRILDSEE